MPMSVRSRVGSPTLGGGVIGDSTILPPQIKNVVVMGASIMDGTVGTAGLRTAFQNILRTRLEHPVTVWDAAVSATTTTTYITEWPALSAAIPASLNNNTTLAYIHIGGNDVTGNRPYTSAQDSTTIATMLSNINWIIDRVEARGWRWVLADLSFRNYDGTTVANEDAGSLPYNERVHQVINFQRNSPYQHADGRSYLDFYTAVYNNRAWLSADNVHLTASGTTGLQNYVAYVLTCIERGVEPRNLVKGGTYYLPPTPAPRSVEAIDPPGSMNLGPAAYAIRPGDVFVYSFGQSGKPKTNQNIQLLTAASAGSTIGGVRYSDGAVINTGVTVVRHFTSTRPVVAETNLSLPPYIGAKELTSCFFLGFETAPSDNGAIKIYGLPPGSYELVFTALREGVLASDVYRTTLIAIEVGTGTTLSGQFLAGQPASGAPGSLTLGDVRPVNGEIQFSVNRLVQSGSLYFAYLGALVVKRVS